ncbi:pyrophosphatase PpaX [Cohnella zeiphila]|uniref:Pyrophosphatase PpaX n=1 Tax=Cohnella zeiphila TaxID=2761120 RepID=A0A7X0SSL5_9BACL|nr:pyrophosphatase PpaX [Cohnella zeiphila]MBB6735372.1 pyrophosphatase PpaX [Cohnella zeiphila]
MAAETNIDTVLFDLDGTIIDTNELIIESFLHALKDIVPEAFGREQIIPYMGMTLVYQMQQFSGREQVEDLVRAYREYNLRRHDEMVTLFPGVAEAVSALKERGFRLGVVTTKMRDSTDRALRLLGIRSAMDVIVTLDDVEHPKPHPEPVLKAIAALGANPSATVMLGDSAADIQSAASAGAIPVGVAWSLKGEAVLREAGAKHVVQDMRQLLTLCGWEKMPG